MLTREQCVARLCALQAEVVARVIVDPAEPLDCFCPNRHREGVGVFTKEPDYFKNTGEAIEWIEQAVREKLHGPSVGELIQQRRDLLVMLDRCATDLETSYDATEYPAHGRSAQEKTAKAARELTTEISPS